MPIDQRLRTGLAGNTDHLVPDLDRELATTYARAHRRRLSRRGLVLAAAAAVAAIAWFADLPDLDGDVVPVAPPPDSERLDRPARPTGTRDPTRWRCGVIRRATALPRAILDVPEGYFTNGGYAVDAGNQYQEPDQWGEVTVWRVDQVLADPCHVRTAADAGTGVEALAQALRRQAGPSTQPRAAVLDDYRGLYLEVTHPAEADLSRCSNGEYTLWRTKPGLLYSQGHPGAVNHLWILDVDGTRLVVAVSNYLDQPAEQHQELIAIAESIHFVEPDS